MCDRDAFQAVLQRLAPDCFARIAKGSEFVILILKQIWVYGAHTHAVSLGEGSHSCSIFQSTREVPLHVHSNGRTGTRKSVNLGRVAQLLFNRCRSGWLKIFPNRVPVLAKPHEGNSMRKASSADQMFSLDFELIVSAPV